RAVHRGEAYVADMVELAQFGHHELANPARGDLALGGHAQLVHDRAHRRLDLLLGHRTLLQRAVEALAQLARVEDFTPPVALHDRGQLQFDRLQGAEALAAGLAFPPATDRRAILADPRVDDPGVGVLAEGAVHQSIRDRGPGTGDRGKGMAGGRLAIDRELRALPSHLLPHR